MMDAARFAELKADIAANGQRVTITLCEGKILDGRNRYKALQELKIEPRLEDFEGDPWAYVWSLNGQRRDLVADQRYLIWKHCNEESDAWQGKQREIAEEANAKRSISQKGVPKAEAKKRSATECRTTFDRHKGQQAKATAAQVNPGAVARGDKLAKERPDLAKKVRLGELKPAEAHRQMKKDAVADKVAEMPKGKYRVIYADPPWSYNDKQSGEISDSYGAAEKHYPSMSLGELSALPVRDFTAKDAVLFLWVTSPLLPEGLKLASDWGFKYKASFIWDKVKHNMGHYNSVRHEQLLVCTKGSCTPDKVKLFDSVQSIERTKKHSQKPDEFRKIIDTLYPLGSRIELFAREAADGWDAWGNEVSRETNQADPDTPCPNCGSMEWSEDENGKFCRKCKHTCGDPVDDDGEPAYETWLVRPSDREAD
jgi:N6-adenosine-specific RNA methylase IME4